MSVTGRGRAFRIDFDDVLVSAEVVYQTTQRACRLVSYITQEHLRDSKGCLILLSADMREAL